MLSDPTWSWYAEHGGSVMDDHKPSEGSIIWPVHEQEDDDNEWDNHMGDNIVDQVE
jgi:hypothetical protein